MSELKPHELTLFYRSLHARGLTTAMLAARVGVCRPTLTRVLNGARKPGPILKRVRSQLTEREEELLTVALCSTWSRKRAALWPRWNPAKLVAQAGGVQ